MASAIKVTQLKSSRNPDPSNATAHHVGGSPPTSFQNPWESYKGISLSTAFKARFGNNPEREFIPVPQGPNGTRSEELVKVRKPDWAQEQKNRLRATWIGHASFLVETPMTGDAKRGVRILFDPVFSEKTGPLGLIGPKRYSPTPCLVSELPEVDIVCISHNHYDHLDYDTITELYKKQKERIHFFVPLNDKAWFTKHICKSDEVTELDWWQSCDVSIEDIGNVKISCTPSQHSSNRQGWNKDYALWSSWVVETDKQKVYFAGDTGYQVVDSPTACPAFKDIGKAFGSFDLALLPIGLMKPANIMGGVHATPEQSLQIHKDIRSKFSIGMHYGTVRGGVSGQYEDVREPPKRWKAAAEKEGLWLGGGIVGHGLDTDTSKEGVCLCDIGETVVL